MGGFTIRDRPCLIYRLPTQHPPPSHAQQLEVPCRHVLAVCLHPTLSEGVPEGMRRPIELISPAYNISTHTEMYVHSPRVPLRPQLPLDPYLVPPRYDEEAAAAGVAKHQPQQETDKKERVVSLTETEMRLLGVAGAALVETAEGIRERWNGVDYWTVLRQAREPAAAGGLGSGAGAGTGAETGVGGAVGGAGADEESSGGGAAGGGGSDGGLRLSLGSVGLGLELEFDGWGMPSSLPLFTVGPICTGAASMGPESPPPEMPYFSGVGNSPSPPPPPPAKRRARGRPKGKKRKRNSGGNC